jgi:gluconolactonase
LRPPPGRCTVLAGTRTPEEADHDPEGKHIGRIDPPARCANLCFGGAHRNRLFMVASTAIYSLYVNTQGAIGG